MKIKLITLPIVLTALLASVSGCKDDKSENKDPEVTTKIVDKNIIGYSYEEQKGDDFYKTGVSGILEMSQDIDTKGFILYKTGGDIVVTYRKSEKFLESTYSQGLKIAVHEVSTFNTSKFIPGENFIVQYLDFKVGSEDFSCSNHFKLSEEDRNGIDFSMSNKKVYNKYNFSYTNGSPTGNCKEVLFEISNKYPLINGDYEEVSKEMLNITFVSKSSGSSPVTSKVSIYKERHENKDK